VRTDTIAAGRQQLRPARLTGRGFVLSESNAHLQDEPIEGFVDLDTVIPYYIHSLGGNTFLCLFVVEINLCFAE
jgi:hypothetical protein